MHESVPLLSVLQMLQCLGRLCCKGLCLQPGYESSFAKISKEFVIGMTSDWPQNCS